MNDSSEARPVIVGYDGSPQAHDALALGAALAAATGGQLILAGAYRPERIVRADQLDVPRAEVLERLAEAADSLPSEAQVPAERRGARGRGPVRRVRLSGQAGTAA